MDILAEEKIIKKRGVTFLLARTVSNWGFKNLTKAHVEFAADLKEIQKKNSAFLYSGLHRSLWETTGILSALYLNNLPIPLVGMGDNLIKGKFFVSLAERTSVFLVKRGNTRRELVESARLLKQYVKSFITYGRDVLLFPEGTRTSIPREGRYGNFFPTAFEALLEYEKEKNIITSQNKNLETQEAYIIPFNSDYSKVREAYELVGYNKNIPRTLRVWDSLKMLKNIRDVYISFGEPIKISGHINKNRKELASMVREKCLDLVKILPINIVSRAIVDSAGGNSINKKDIYDSIDKLKIKLESLSDKFRGFSIDDTPEEICSKVSRYNSDYIEPEIGKIPVYQLYANYIHHYLD
ncbi:MAG: 1-acyl-sn-glycerol-3-phosphate acyltransferase [Acidobacteriota bacterium]